MTRHRPLRSLRSLRLLRSLRSLELPVALATVSLLAACLPEDGGGPPRVGDPVPSFAAPLLQDAPGAPGGPGLAGDTLSLADFQGSPTLLNLWATWCPPCRHETPFLEEISERYEERGLRVVGISVDNRGAVGQARGFLQEAGADYLQLHDPNMGIMDLFSVPGLPSTFLVDREGIIRWARLGPVTEDDPDFLAALDSLVGERP